jgi:hypothetical protein
MECTVAPNNLAILCRICLTSSKNMVHLSTPVCEENSDLKKQAVHTMLEFVTSYKVRKTEVAFF